MALSPGMQTLSQATPLVFYISLSVLEWTSVPHLVTYFTSEEQFVKSFPALPGQRENQPPPSALANRTIPC